MKNNDKIYDKAVHFGGGGGVNPKWTAVYFFTLFFLTLPLLLGMSLHVTIISFFSAHIMHGKSVTTILNN